MPESPAKAQALRVSPCRDGDGFRAEMLIEQHRQGGETAAIAGVDEEEHGEHRPEQRVVDAIRDDLQQADGDGHDEDNEVARFATLEMIGECGESDAPKRVEHRIHGEHRGDDARGSRGEGGRTQGGESRELAQHVVQDVLLLGDERQAAGDVDVEGDPDAPEHVFAQGRVPLLWRPPGSVKPEHGTSSCGDSGASAGVCAVVWRAICAKNPSKYSQSEPGLGAVARD